MTEQALQRDYYARTAKRYDENHVQGGRNPEHHRAMEILLGLAKLEGFGSFLDVGSGTGRGMVTIQERFPSARVRGVEPCRELREEAHGKGIPREALTDGDAMSLDFADGACDCVCAFGIMHHLPQPRRAIAEMLRVAGRAVFISDLNGFGCGPLAQRLLAHTLRAAGLWKFFQFVKNGDRMWKFSEGDGVHYSYSLFDDLPLLKSRSRETLLFTTQNTGGSPLWSCSHVAVLALK